uniref:Uncharacterized protein n=1 Tax=Panagrolaimus davidi TaxID=227884 RepID=A0A914PYY3_9BILA
MATFMDLERIIYSLFMSKRQTCLGISEDVVLLGAPIALIIIEGHLDYSRKLTEVLEAVGIKVTPRSNDSNDDLQNLEKEEIEKDILDIKNAMLKMFQ